MDEATYRLVSDGWYNGFNLQVRLAVGKRQNAAFKSGSLKRPSACMVCGLGDGIVMAHLEDYADWRRYFPMCFVCHSTLHGRYKRPTVFTRYMSWLQEGNRPIPYRVHDWRAYQAAYCWEGATWPSSGKCVGPNLSLLSVLPMEYTHHVPEHLKCSSGTPLLEGQHDGRGSEPLLF